MAIIGNSLSSALTATKVPSKPPPASRIAAETSRAPIELIIALMAITLLAERSRLDDYNLPLLRVK